MRNRIRNLLKRIVKLRRTRLDQQLAKSFLNDDAMRAIHQSNKTTLAQVPVWITDDVWMSGVFQYGLPKEIRHLIDADLGDGVTYTDAMLSLAPMLRKPVKYIEIGVSVGKNFLQVSRHLESACLTAFDIEEINPTLKAQYEMISRIEFGTMATSLKKTPSSLTSFRQHQSSNQVEYLCGDVFDSGAWSQLKGRKFNFLFSDAFHSPEALYSEFRTLMDNDLLDQDEVIIVWDDLHNEMEVAFRAICRKLEHARPDCQSTSFIAPLRGWLGDNWGYHPVGFFLSMRSLEARCK